MNEAIVIGIALAALVSALVQAISHWFPWRLALGRELPRVWAYVVGVLGFLLPVTVLYWRWDVVGLMVAWSHLVALWACVVASGLAVVLGYAIDGIANRVRLSHELEELHEAQTARK
jgi:hypothetical protein